MWVGVGMVEWGREHGDGIVGMGDWGWPGDGSAGHFFLVVFVKKKYF